MVRPEHQFDIRLDLRKAASTKAESTTAEPAIRPKQLVRVYSIVMLNRCATSGTRHYINFHKANDKEISIGKLNSERTQCKNVNNTVYF